MARLLTGVALGASVATATAYIADLDAGPDGAPSRRSGIVATIANVGGLALGPLLAGALAQYVPGGLTLTFVVLLVALIVASGRRRPLARGSRAGAAPPALPAAAAAGARAGARAVHRREHRRRSSPSPSAGCSPVSPARSWPGHCTTPPRS